jgi:hypothetical protein
MTQDGTQRPALVNKVMKTLTSWATISFSGRIQNHVPGYELKVEWLIVNVQQTDRQANVETKSSLGIVWDGGGGCG